MSLENTYGLTEDLLTMDEGSFTNTSTNSSVEFDSSESNSFNFNLTSWHRAQLVGLSKVGINCLMKSWKSLARNPLSEPHCNAAWDEIYCWPPTPAGQTVRVPCSEVMKEEVGEDASKILGDAFRICTDDATWLWGNWTNYNVCIEAVENMESLNNQGESFPFKVIIRHILFIGSILSLVSLVCAIFIFRYFRSLQCDRNLIHVHMMAALGLRSILWLITTESTIFEKKHTYRSVDWVCKTIIALQIYAAAAAINWMFVQGHYLHSKLTSNVWQKTFPLGLYVFIGWGIPLLLVSIWCCLMAVFHEQPCWKGYGKLDYLWIVACPLVLVLIINMLLLFNILRILLTKIQLSSLAREQDQFKRAVKATIVLFPLLGLNNLVFFYNPGGTGERYYMLINAILQCAQGPAVACLYCFLCKDVQEAIRRQYRRFSAKQEIESEKTISYRSTFTSIKSRFTLSDKHRSIEQTDCIDINTDSQYIEFPKVEITQGPGSSGSYSQKEPTPSDVFL